MKFDPVSALQRFFASYRFPALTLGVLAAFELFLVAVLAAPRSLPVLGAFAEEFKVWCFGYDPANGDMEWAYALMMLAHPLVIGGVIGVIWYAQLKQVIRARPRALLPYAALATLIAATGLVALAGVGSSDPQRDLPFPARDLRTAHVAPPLALQNQNGEPVTLSELRGRVVLLTGIYASCGHTCPLILQQAKRALATLGPKQREDLSVVAITLDPDHDTPQALTRLAGIHELTAPSYQLLTGEPRTVNRTLDALQIARKRNPETGVIDHANLFILVDRSGKIAYRLTLGERQERWLIEALVLLLGEPRPGEA